MESKTEKKKETGTITRENRNINKDEKRDWNVIGNRDKNLHGTGTVTGTGQWKQ